MKKIIIVLIIIAALAGGGFYYYKITRSNNIYVGVEEFLKKGSLISSTAKIKQATFSGHNNKCTAYFQIVYTTGFGGPADAVLNLDFAGKGVNPTSSEAVKKIHAMDIERDQKKIDNGSLVIDPFKRMELVGASLNGQELDEISLLSLKTSILSAGTKGAPAPSTGGKITKLDKNGNHEFTFFVQTYTPGKLFPYE